MIAFMADMLVSEYMTVDLDLISEIVLLVIDLRICLVLRSEVWREDSVPSIWRLKSKEQNTDLCAMSSRRFMGTLPLWTALSSLFPSDDSVQVVHQFQGTYRSIRLEAPCPYHPAPRV
jgi:hypothetical protein